MKKRSKLVSLLLVFVMMFSLCGCGAQASNGEEKKTTGEEKETTGDMESVADDKSDAEKEEMKSDFVVKINEKEYDLTKDFSKLFSDAEKDNGEFSYRLTAVTREFKDGQYFEDSVLETIFTAMDSIYGGILEHEGVSNDCVIKMYYLPTHIDAYSYSETVQNVIDNKENVDKDIYFVTKSKSYQNSNEITGLYADGQLIDITKYREQCNGLDNEKTLNEFLSEKGMDISDINWAGELKAYMSNNTDFSSWSDWPDMKLSKVKEIVPDMEEEMSRSLACFDLEKMVVEGSIKEYGTIIFFTDVNMLQVNHYMKDDNELQRVNDRMANFIKENET